MSTLQVANIHFESTGTNRIDFPAGGNTMFLRAENVAVTGTYTINSEQLIVGTLGAANTTILGANIVTGNVTVTRNILKSGLPFLFQGSNVVVFEASGTYNPLTNVQYALVIATGGGAGGGTATGSDATSGVGAAGGGAGGTAIRLYPYSQVNGATVTIGARGAVATTGGNTTFTAVGGGTSLTANGGSAGVTQTNATAAAGTGVAGGAASGGQINIIGGSSSGGVGTDAGNFAIGGIGGGSFWGGGGAGSATISSVSVPGGNAGLTTYGAGGGGGSISDLAASASGGLGANGVVFILEFSA